MGKMTSGGCADADDDDEIRLGKRERGLRRGRKRRKEEEKKSDDDDHLLLQHHKHNDNHQYNYPSEIIMDILSRLPVESVLECRGVCRNWRTLLLDTYFGHVHLQRHGLMMSQQYYDDDHHGYHHHDEYQQYHNRSLLRCSSNNNVFASASASASSTNKKINHRPFKKKHRSIVGSCNGLICLISRVNKSCNSWRHPVYIYNPITVEYVKLPKINYETDLRDYVGSAFCHPWTLFIGFGYLPSTNEYKVVRIIYHSLLNYPRPFYANFKVYTLGAGTGWRDKGVIPYMLEGHSSPRSKAGVMANGALHWVGGDGEIVAFDLAKEEFHPLPSPPGLPSLPPARKSVRLWVLGGVLYLVKHVKPINYEVWSLKKKDKSVSSCYDMNEFEYQSWSWSWNREFTGPSDIRIEEQHPLFVLNKSREFVLLDVRGDRTLYRFDPKVQTDEAPKVFGNLDPALFIQEAVPHINSFVSLKALGEDAKIIRPLAPWLMERLGEDDEDSKNNRTS